ncbi:hypothetical protein HPB52_005043 [Rhipicephalus sanguineus]|uniref:Uncharacterized protein n=1 Tax=Rhipicephalus sanguineus TaxID=34632 RepID=A0A9D4Q9X0_RHISA|nr:hypothetical protein HPB52_005043 [Rhipicephalus sanguineus]
MLRTDPCRIVPLIATAACRARTLGFCIRHKVLPPEVRALFGHCLSSFNHGVRICKGMRSEWQRQTRMYRDQLRLLLEPRTNFNNWREYSRLADRTTEFLWQQDLQGLRTQVQKKPSAPSNSLHVIGDVNLPDKVPQQEGKGKRRGAGSRY